MIDKSFEEIDDISWLPGSFTAQNRWPKIDEKLFAGEEPEQRPPQGEHAGPATQPVPAQ